MDETWNEGKIPITTQEIVNFVIDTKIDELSKKPTKEIYEIFKKIHKDYQNQEVKEEIPEPKQSIDIYKDTYKVLNCTNEWVFFMLENIRMISLFDISKIDMILQQVNQS